MFVALSRLRLGDGWIEPGETVPVQPGRDYRLMEQLGQIVVLPDKGKGSAKTEPEPPDPGKQTRAELEERAHEAGIEEPDALPNKEALAETISEREHLDGLSRRELDKRAADAGVDSPEKLPNKGAVIDALMVAGE